MISINNISYFLGDRTLFENASLFIDKKDQIGLIGLNGTGKSTLLKMMVGELEVLAGDISMSNSTTIGFLNQDLLSYESDQSILHVAMMAFEDTLKLQHQMDAIIKEMEENYRDELVPKLTKLQEQFEAEDGYALQARAEELLEGIGFKTSDLTRPLREFSGGWRMRVMLAKLLLARPSLLMLDEPTNHLDLPSIQWIENYLQTYEGAYIIVSHDRRFLNATTKKIVEIYNSNLHVYKGNYDFYEQEKGLRNELQQNAFENQQQKIKQTEQFITRFRAKATKARQVQSKVKMLNKIDRIASVVDENLQVNFQFNFKTKSGRHVKRGEHLNKSYGDHLIVKDTTAHIERGDKIALIGSNGKGKSTVLRMIAETEPYEGKIDTGHNVITSFYAQHQLEALHLGNNLIEELMLEGTGKTEQELRSVLGCFLFSNDDVFKKIKVLSGGEKSRVALAKTLISEANFLLLDEPTNHLDMLSVNILVQALQQYEGTFLLVSHDRYFISQVANKIWWIENHELKEYLGTYEEYTWWMSRRKEKRQATELESKKKKPKLLKQEKSCKNPKDQRQKKELEKLESQISVLEDKVAQLEIEMSYPSVYQDAEAFQTLNTNYQTKKSKLDHLMNQWEEMG